MKNITQTEIIKTQACLHNYLSNQDCQPQVQGLDNKYPEELKEYFQSRDITF